MKTRMKLIVLAVVFSLYPSTFAGDYVPLDIEDGMWEVKFNFENMLSAQQKAQMKQALARLEEMKKQNPAMAAQLSQMTKSMGVSENTVTRKNCLNRRDMCAEMDKMLNRESSSESKCQGKVLKSTAKMIEGKSICGDKTHHYKIKVQDKKHMSSVITTSEGKTMTSTFKWLSSKCSKESLGQ